MSLLILLIILLLVFGGGGIWTSRPGYGGPDVGGLLWVLAVVVIIVLVVQLMGIG
jgi:hypothetical protein